MGNEISNKIISVSIVIVLLAIGVYAYTQQIPNPGHGADTVLVSVDGYSMNLQEAITHGVLVDGASATQSYTTQAPDPGHTGNNIYVSVNGNEKTLQQAISTTLCGSGSHSYSSGISLGHSADKILVSSGGSEMSLQDAINSGEFCITCTSHASSTCYNNDVYWYDSCGVREEKETECGTSAYTGSNYCYDNDVYKSYITRGCSGVSCTSSTGGIKQEECGANGCSGGSCITCTSHASSTCYNNDVYWYDSCGVREEKASECGIDSYGAFGAWYCSTATVRQRDRTFHDRGCSAGACFDSTSIDSETTNCGGNYCESWGSWYCQDDNTRRRDRTCHNRGCSGSSCYDNTYTDFETIACGGGTICLSGSCQYPTVCQYNLGTDYYFMAKCDGRYQTMIRWDDVQVYQSMKWELGPITVGSYEYSRGSVKRAGGECSPPYYYTVCRQQQ